MNIDVAVARQLQHPGRNDSAVADDDDCLGPQGLKLCLEFFILLDFFRLNDWKAKFQCRLLDRRRCQRHAAKNNLHALSPARTSFLILRLIRSRLSALTWLIKSLPFRWSISCRKARASRSSPVFSNQFPSTSCARTVTILARVTFSRKSGRLRQPSWPFCLPSRPMTSGFTSTSLALGSSLNVVSITAMRLPMPIYGAASPTPWAAYMDSNMSSTSFFSSALNSVTGSAGLSSTGSP